MNYPVHHGMPWMSLGHFSAMDEKQFQEYVLLLIDGLIECTPQGRQSREFKSRGGLMTSVSADILFNLQIALQSAQLRAGVPSASPALSPTPRPRLASEIYPVVPIFCDTCNGRGVVFGMPCASPTCMVARELKTAKACSSCGYAPCMCDHQ